MRSIRRIAVLLAILAFSWTSSRAQPPPEITVVGRVTDEAGGPVAGAEVRGSPWSPGVHTRRELRAQTDGQGTYALRGIPADAEQLSFQVEHPDFPSIQHRVRLDTLTTSELRQDFVLRVGGTVTGQVTTPDGPSPGVRIQSRSLGPPHTWQSTTTDSEGRYTLHLAEGEHAVMADYPDYAPAPAQVSVRMGERIVADLALTAGKTISGQVVNEASNPVAGASVSAFSRSGVGGSSRRARTDREGRFEIRGLVEGEVMVSVSHRSYAQLREVQATAGATDLHLVLQRAKILSGRVVDAESGQPVEGFEVYMASAGHFYELARPHRVTMLSDGRFLTEEGLDPGAKYNVVVSAPRYAWSLIEGVTVDSVTATEGLEIALSRGATLRGRVVSDDGRPVVGARVQEMMPGAQPWSPMRGPYLKAARTDETGTFIFEDASPDGIDVWVSHPDFVDVRQKAVPTELDALVEFRMDRGLAIVGRVFRAGRPAEGLQVTAGPRERTDTPVRPAQTTSDADGRYRLEHLRPGLYGVLLIEGEGMEQMPIRSMDVELVDQDVTLDFRPLGEGKIHGTVVLDGQPTEGARVMASIGGGDPKDRTLVGSAVTGAEGRYELSELPADRVSLDVYKRDPMQMGIPDKRLSAKDEVDLRTIGEVEHRIDLKVEHRKALKVGDPAPELVSTLLDGSPIRLSDYRGRVVLLDFWATWCGPCIAELPNVKRVYQKYHDRGLEILGISLDSDRKALADFVKKEGLTYPQVFDGKAWQTEIAKAYGVWSIPSVFLIDREGILRATGLRGQALDHAVAQVLSASR